MLSLRIIIFASLATLATPALAQSNPTAPPMDLACGFLLLASSALTLGADGKYDGNFGISPTVIAGMTIPSGLKPVSGESYFTASPQLNGFAYGPGDSSGGAHYAMLNAYTFASNSPLSGAVDDRPIALGGQTFTRGVYKWSAPAASAASSEITLNGAAGDVFIFLFNTLTTGASSNVRLVGGVTPDTIFWVSGSTVTLGASSFFHGWVLAGTTVTIGASAQWSGAAYAQTAITTGASVLMSNPFGSCAIGGTPSAGPSGGATTTTAFSTTTRTTTALSTTTATQTNTVFVTTQVTTATETTSQVVTVTATTTVTVYQRYGSDSGNERYACQPAEAKKARRTALAAPK